MIAPLDWANTHPQAIATDGTRVVVAIYGSLKSTMLPVGSGPWSEAKNVRIGAYVFDVKYGHGLFVAAGYSSGPMIIFSADGVEWTRARLP
jgi:hypothetical protein